MSMEKSDAPAPGEDGEVLRAGGVASAFVRVVEAPGGPAADAILLERIAGRPCAGPRAVAVTQAFFDDLDGLLARLKARDAPALLTAHEAGLVEALLPFERPVKAVERLLRRVGRLVGAGDAAGTPP